MAEYAISGDVATLAGDDHTAGDPAALWIESSAPILVDSTTGRIGGRLRVTLEDDGTFEQAGLPETVSGATPLYRLVVDSLTLRRAGNRRGITTGWFPLTTNRDLTWIIANYVEVTPLTTELATQVAAAAALGDNNNTMTASFITGAGDTQTALDARIATQVPAASTTTPGRVELATTTETQTGTDTTRAITPSVAAKAFKPVITPEAYGAVGDGVTDDTTAWIDACAAANATLRVGLGGNIYEPGATIQARGKYKLTTIAAPLVVSANMDAAQAELIIPNAYADAAILAGHPDDGLSLHNADIVLPSVIKSGATSLPAGGVGVKIQNLQHSRLRARRTTHHETGLWFTALGAGNCYNEYFIGWLDLCMVSIKLAPLTGGWVNQNTFIAGGITQSPNAYGGAAVRRAGWRHLVLDGGAGHTVHANTFVGISLEGDISEWFIAFANAAENIFTGSTRFEQGTAGTPVTVNATTNVFTAVGHGLTGGLMVSFTAASMPGGMTSGGTYYVQAGATADTFKISTVSGGADLDVTSTGSSVLFYRPARILFDNTSGFTKDNIIRDYNTYPGPLDVIRSGAAAPAAKAPIVG